MQTKTVTASWMNPNISTVRNSPLQQLTACSHVALSV